MTKRELEVGDRVRVYVNAVTEIEGVVNAVGTGAIEIMLPSKIKWGWAHKKQCRRLIPKARKSVWVNEYENGHSSYDSAESAERNTYPDVIRVSVEYREVKRGEK